jgi:hypothetical protein
MYHPGIFLEGLRKLMINLSQVNWYLDQDLEKGHLEYRPVVATTQLQYYYVSDVNLAAEQSVSIHQSR